MDPKHEMAKAFGAGCADGAHAAGCDLACSDLDCMIFESEYESHFGVTPTAEVLESFYAAYEARVVELLQEVAT